jgi:hypothetical protein
VAAANPTFCGANVLLGITVLRFPTKNSDNVFDRDNEKLVVGLEIDGDGVLGME